MGRWQHSSLLLLQGVTSYVIVRPLCTALALITSQAGCYSEGSWKPNNSYPYLAMATNVSQVKLLNSMYGSPFAAQANLSVAEHSSSASLINTPSLILAHSGHVLNGRQ